MLSLRLSLFSMFLFCGASITGLVQAQNDCLNFAQYPFGTFTPDASGALTEVSTCVFFQEYTHFTGFETGSTYQFNISNDGYITLREGTFDGPVVASAYSYLVYTATSTSDLFAHYTVNENCDLGTTCEINSVQKLIDCIPPQVWYSYTNDCTSGEHFIELDITSLGDSPSLTVEYSIFGTPYTVTDVPLGVLSLGPFFDGEIVDVTVQHSSDASCNITFTGLNPAYGCPYLLECGAAPAAFTHCYGNLEQSFWIFEGLGTGSLMLNFFAGTIEESWADQFVIYDGPDDTYPILFQHDGFVPLDLAGLNIISTGPDMYMVLTTNDFNSCSDGTQTEMSWQIACLNCALPSATVSVVDDCANNQFSLVLDVTSTGDAATMGVEYEVDGVPQTVTGLGVGETTIGPFTVNDDVIVTLLHESNTLCNLMVGTYTDTGLCPTLIVCGDPAIDETYCYTNNDVTSWGYEAVGAGTLRLTFSAGSIESSNWDQLTIYDGTDATGTILFEHTEFNTIQLAGIDVFASSGNMFMQLSTDGSVSCEDASFGIDPWAWTVVCLDCQLPQLTSTIVDDCPNNQFSVELDITTVGDGGLVDIEYTVNGGTPVIMSGVDVGNTVLGPFEINDIVNVTIQHGDNELCNVYLGDMTDTGTCPTLIECGTEYTETLCYDDNLDVVYYYQGIGTFPLYVNFTAGTIENCCDFVYIYDGADVTAPLIYQGNNFGDLAGLFYTSTNPENKLTIRFTSDGSVACTTSGGFYIPLEWTLGCLDCNPPVANFMIVQDCENFQYYVDVNLSDLGSDPEVEILNTGGAPELSVTAPGSVMVGPFTSGTPVQITIVNDANNLCNLVSATLVNPICPLTICGTTPVVENYCYDANENMAWAYEAPGGTLHLMFDLGTIEDAFWDQLMIYDGTDNSAPLLFSHNGVTSELGPVGSAVNGPGTNYYAVDVTSTGANLYMELFSDGVVQCTDDFGFDPWQWQVSCVGCQPPGISYSLVADCEQLIYKALVNVDQVSGPNGVQITEATAGESITLFNPGAHLFETFDLDSMIYFNVVDLDNPGCTYVSDMMTYTRDSCIIESCGIDNYTLCYGNDEDRWYTFRSTGDFPVAIYFHQGQMLGSGDRISIYNGTLPVAGPPSNLIYTGNNSGNLTGFAANSANADNALTLHIQSDGSGSCETGEASIALNWDIGCGAVGLDEIGQNDFSIYPNPTNGLLTIDLGTTTNEVVRVRVMDMSGRIAHEELIPANNGSATTMDLGKLQNGQYMVQLISENWVGIRSFQMMR